MILEHIMNIFDSNKKFFLNGHLNVNFDHIQLPHGSGRTIRREFGQTNTDFINEKASFLKYQNPAEYYPDDEYCLPYALVLAKIHRQELNGGIKKRTLQNYQRYFKTLRRAVEKPCKEAGVVIRPKLCARPCE